MSGNYSDPDLSTERMWLEDTQVDRPEPDDLLSAFETYVEEGHLIVQFHVGAHSPGQVWYAVCSCDETSWGGPRSEPPTTLLTYWDVKWCRSPHEVKAAPYPELGRPSTPHRAGGCPRSKRRKPPRQVVRGGFPVGWRDPLSTYQAKESKRG